MPNTDLHQLIAKAWDYRESYQIQKCQEVLQSLRKNSKDKSITSAQELVQIKLLEVSLWRSQGQLDQSLQEMKLIERWSQEDLFPLPFEFYFQKALNFLIQDQTAMALEFFLQARQRSSSAKQTQTSLINILLCLENLGLPYQQTLRDLEQHLATVHDKAVRLRIEKILLGFYQRQDFRNGRIKKVFSYESEEKDLLQMQYYKFWVSELPYIEFSWKEKTKVVSELVTNQFHLKDYRLQTVMVDSRFETKGPAPMTEQSDRIYLWTWRWLVNPSDHHQMQLSQLLNDFDFSLSLKKMTCEDIQMVRNSLLWICLLQPQNKVRLHQFLTLLNHQNVPSFPIFEYERLWIDYVSAVKAKDHSQRRKLSKSLKEHPLARSSGISMSRIIEKVILSLEPGKTSSQTVQVEPTSGRVLRRGQTIFISQPVASLLALLKEVHSVTFAEALDAAYGIRPYDEGIHQPKIHNLVSRIKKVLPPGLSIQTRQQRIFLLGDLEMITVSNSGRSLKIENARAVINNRKLRQESVDRWIHPRLILKKVAGKKDLSRQQLQSLIKTSKATANRWINQWIEEGLIQKVGQGRKTVYHIEIM